jgi:hypothetical protein
VLDRQSGPRQRGRYNDVHLIEPALHLPVEPRAQEDRPVELLELLRRIARGTIELRHQGGIHARPVLL